MNRHLRALVSRALNWCHKKISFSTTNSGTKGHCYFGTPCIYNSPCALTTSLLSLQDSRSLGIQAFRFIGLYALAWVARTRTMTLEVWVSKSWKRLYTQIPIKKENIKKSITKKKMNKSDIILNTQKVYFSACIEPSSCLLLLLFL